MENMVKGCGRSDLPVRMPRILIPKLVSVVNNLTTTTYASTSTIYQPFSIPLVGPLASLSTYCTPSDMPTTGLLAQMSVCPTPLPAL